MIVISTITCQRYTDDGFEPFILVPGDEFDILRTVYNQTYLKTGEETLKVHEMELKGKYRIEGLND